MAANWNIRYNGQSTGSAGITPQDSVQYEYNRKLLLGHQESVP